MAFLSISWRCWQNILTLFRWVFWSRLNSKMFFGYCGLCSHKKWLLPISHFPHISNKNLVSNRNSFARILSIQPYITWEHGRIQGFVTHCHTLNKVNLVSVKFNDPLYKRQAQRSLHYIRRCQSKVICSALVFILLLLLSKIMQRSDIHTLSRRRISTHTMRPSCLSIYLIVLRG